MEFSHKSVLLWECIDALNIRPNGIYLDGTLGGGGHSLEICRRLTNGRLIGVDRDEVALEAAKKRLSRHARKVTLVHDNFENIALILDALNLDKIDGMLFDLGVSSPQLDDGSRGFSYMADAPLDMRMDQSTGLTAAEYLAQVTPEEFRRILTDYGEEKWAARIAQIFAEKRAQKPIETTADLVAVVDAAIPKAVRRKDDGHPARRTFQAVRIAVNDELAPLEKALRDFVELLAPGGRLLVITFHSLEDRIVKNTFRAMQHPCTCPTKAPICTCGKVPLGKALGGGGVKPSNREVQENVRARSAKLRIFEKNREEGE